MSENSLSLLQILTVLLLLSFCGCSEQDPDGNGDQKNFSTSSLYDNKMLQYFADNHPGQTILKYAQADLDDDGREDLIVIYNVEKSKNQMCVIHYNGEDLTATNSVPAPVSDQLITFRDIDEKPPLEFIVQGRKGAKVGYAIFRIEEGILADLFGEGMEDCC
ncbi:MAG: Cys-Cys-COOH (seleno)protein SaoC [Desulforhopalus sp.]